MDRGNFEAPPLRADGKGSYISEIQLLQVLRGVEFHPEKLAKKRQREVLTLEQ
ncbi:hypothetical protein FM107_17990 [Sphingobacterium sp. JB170]|nr:hypothetical protein FM107_17990 [Sphingobacterium sp. JB170]